MKKLLQLYTAFFRIGLFTFGGGLAMLPLLQKEVVHKYKWATEEELVDYYAIGQCTPGIIAVNTATFVGYKERGILGGIVTTLGVISPSLVIITLIAAFFASFKDLEIVSHAFAGIRVAVTVLIGTSVYNLAKKSLIDLPSIIIAIAVLAVNLLTDVSPVFVILAAGLAGILIKYFAGRRKS